MMNDLMGERAIVLIVDITLVSSINGMGKIRVYKIVNFGISLNLVDR
jgi:hypothetical protein